MLIFDNNQKISRIEQDKPEGLAMMGCKKTTTSGPEVDTFQSNLLCNICSLQSRNLSTLKGHGLFIKVQTSEEGPSFFLVESEP